MDVLKLGIGNEEAVTLQPKLVNIKEVVVEPVGIKKSNKVICLCTHPDAPAGIKISAVKYEDKGKLETVGLWVNIDSKEAIRKGSALAVFLQATGSRTIEELKGKDVMTATGDKGYLCFKAY